MNKFLILFLFNLSDTIDVPYYKDAKVILDGKLDEEIYGKACKIKDLVQVEPVPFESPPESTHIFLFQTDKGFFIGLRCFTKDREPDRSMFGDNIQVFLDTYFDKENAYMFLVYANGKKFEAKWFNGGEGVDYNVDFLWEGKVYSYKNYFDVEIFVPWKGLMGKKGEWGIDIVRVGPSGIYTARLSPYDPFKEKFHISRFKVIKMVNYVSKLITTEVQPILLVHNGRDFGYKYNFKYDFCSNIYFKFKENIKFAFTFNPDFGEVEADPFRLNLSKYPLFYEETRPFFTEGSEFFKLSGFSPFNVFYSRQIGKTLPSGKTIPIFSAEKFFIKKDFFEFSFLHSRTKEVEDMYSFIKRADFLISKIRILPAKFFSISFLNAHKLTYKEKTKGLIGAQIFYNDSLTMLDIESVFDNYVSHDFAQKIKFEKIIKNLTFSSSLTSIPDSFSDEEVGFIPWKGEKSFSIGLGYNFFVNKKILYFTPLFDFGYSKELGEPYGFSFSFNPSLTFNNLISLLPLFGYEKSFEMEEKIESPFFGLFIGNLFTTLTKNKVVMQVGGYANKIYNYTKSYIGWVNTNYFNLISNFKSLTIISDFYQWNEFDPEGKLAQTTYSIRFVLGLNLPKRISIRFYSHIPVSQSKVLQERFGIFLSWNPLEKNEIKTIYNHFRIKNEDKWETLIEKETTKLNYSIYF
ncbi:MAG: DUF5916 domain-containing protein [candidate division WOR-3 bacterium]